MTRALLDAMAAVSIRPTLAVTGARLAEIVGRSAGSGCAASRDAAWSVLSAIDDRDMEDDASGACSQRQGKGGVLFVANILLTHAATLSRIALKTKHSPDPTQPRRS
jgi:hypothetical protein